LGRNVKTGWCETKKKKKRLLAENTYGKPNKKEGEAPGPEGKELDGNRQKKLSKKKSRWTEKGGPERATKSLSLCYWGVEKKGK